MGTSLPSQLFGLDQTPESPVFQKNEVGHESTEENSMFNNQRQDFRESGLTQTIG